MPMNFLKETGFLMSRGNEAPLAELNPGLASVIEDTILFGRIEEFEKLTEILVDHPQVSDELRHGLEGLKFFRMHYASGSATLSEAARQRVNQFDTFWSMHLIDMVREGYDEAEASDYSAQTA